MLEETPKANQLEDDRFNRMEHFYGSDEMEADMLEDLELGDDGKVNNNRLFFDRKLMFFLCLGWL